MNFVTVDGSSRWQENALHSAQLLAGNQSGGHGQPAKPRAAARIAFQPVRILNPLTQHLEAPANTQHLATITQVFFDLFVPSLLAQECQVSAGCLTTREDDQIRRRPDLTHFHKTQLHLRVQAQRIKIIVIAHARQHRYHHLEGIVLMVTGIGHRVLRIQRQAMQVGQHTEHRFAGAIFQPVQPALQQGQVPTKPVDDKAQGALLLAL